MKRLSDLFGRYSLPNVMGRLGHRIGGLFHGDNPPPISPTHYPISPVGGLTENQFNGYGDSFDQTGSFNPQGEYGGPGQMSDPFGNGFLGGMGSGSGRTGTLGGGSVVDPSQWGAFGFGDNDAGNSVPYRTQFMSRMGEGGGGAGNLLGSGFFQQRRMHTGGGLPAQGYDSSGINPGGMYTGGNAQSHPIGMQAGGNLPAQTIYGRLGGKQPPGGLMR